MKSCVTYLVCNHGVRKEALKMLILLVLPSLHHCCDRSVALHCGREAERACYKKREASLLEAADLRSVQVTKERRRFRRRFKYKFAHLVEADGM